VDRSWGAPTVTYDGSTVADEIELRNPFENMGARMIKEAASKTSDDAGDGTTTSAVLAEAIFEGAYKYVAGGANPMAVARGIRRAAQIAADAVGELKKEVTVKNRDWLIRLGRIAAKGDESVGTMLADAFEKVGKEGAVSVEEGKGIQTEIRTVEGMQFDRGFLSPQFVTNPEAVECVLEEPYILIHEEKLSSARKLIPLLEALAQKKASLLVIAEDVEGEALATLVVNKLRGVLPACAVKAPGYGDRRKAMLQDIAILTGGTPLFKDLGYDLEKVGPDKLGRARKVIVDNEYTTILEGAGSRKEIEARAAQIRREIEETDSDYDREKLEERLARLVGGVAQILVGAATEAELKERKQRVEDALGSIRAALAEGIVPGGGVAYLRAQEALAKARGFTGDEEFGRQVVLRALEAPFRALLENAGIEPTVFLREVKEAKGWKGFDVERGEITDLEKAGIADPAKVVRLALLNGASVASMLITSDALVAELPEKEKAAKQTEDSETSEDMDDEWD
jgi:chaperonin GroEL